jgi:hypothetical protein
VNWKLLAAGLTIGMLGLAPTGAGAANEPLIVWQGAATITAVNKTCRSNIGHGVGDTALSVFRPRLVADEPPSALTMIFGRSAYTFFRQTGPEQMDGAGTWSGPLITGRATTVPGGASGNYNFNVSPNVVTETTKFINITGTLTNFAGVAGCTAKFTGGYSQRPN